MVDQEHLDIFKQGVDIWNKWRNNNPTVLPDLSYANLHKANFREANLRGVDFRGANLKIASFSGADLGEADLRGANLAAAFLSNANLKGTNFGEANLSEADFGILANLNGAFLSSADLSYAHLHRAKLRSAFLYKANLSYTDLTCADLSYAYLDKAMLVETILVGAILTGCRIYGIAAWNVELNGASQNNLVITRDGEPTITVDNLEVAQFIYLLLNNERIRHVIDTITSKVVLILGRFTPERKRVLDAIRGELRNKDCLPVVFDFDVPTNRNVTETVTTLARLARFIIADLTDPKSIPQELAFIVPDLPSVPVQPLLHVRSKEYGMYEHFKSFPWVLPAYRYTTVDRLLASLREHVIEPAENRAKELAIERAKRLERP